MDLGLKVILVLMASAAMILALGIMLYSLHCKYEKLEKEKDREHWKLWHYKMSLKERPRGWDSLPIKYATLSMDREIKKIGWTAIRDDKRAFNVSKETLDSVLQGESVEAKEYEELRAHLDTYLHPLCMCGHFDCEVHPAEGRINLHP